MHAFSATREKLSRGRDKSKGKKGRQSSFFLHLYFLKTQKLRYAKYIPYQLEIWGSINKHYFFHLEQNLELWTLKKNYETIFNEANEM